MLSALQVNVRYGEGGAAQVARGLAAELESRGHRSHFVYGYGPHGGNSALADHGSTRLTPRPLVAANLLSYRLFGADLDVASPRSASDLDARLAEVDVVHLHAIHSYFVGTKWLFDRLKKAGKPVIWTLHDQWLLTGRCAQPGGCDLWMSGCQSCPNLAAYPPALVDQASSQWDRRRDLIIGLGNSVPLRFVACAKWLQRDALQAGFDDVRFVPNSVDRAFWEATVGSRAGTAGGPPRNLFVARDLADRGKVDWEVLQEIGSDPTQKLTVVGNGPPSPIPGATLLAAQNDRARLADVYKAHDRLIYMSTVDYFPLTVVEALVAGLDVLILDSPAAREFAHHPQVRIVKDLRSLVSAASEPVWTGEGRQNVRMEYAPERMASNYMALYQEVSR